MMKGMVTALGVVAIAMGTAQAMAAGAEDFGLEESKTSIRGGDTASDTTFVGKRIDENFSVGGYSTTTVTGGYDDSTGSARQDGSRGSHEDTSYGIGLKFDF